MCKYLFSVHLRGANNSPDLGARVEFVTLSPGASWRNFLHFSLFQKFYRNELKINICQSSQHLWLQVSGRGLEPQLEFSPTVLELGPLLPYSCGAEGTVLVRNPCEFPIEFYSLEFDEQYLAEEQVRRKVWSPHMCSHSFTVLQHSQDYLHASSQDDEDIPRVKPGGVSGPASSAGRLWRVLDSPC